MGLIVNVYDKRYRQDNYIDWSTILDAPLSLGCTLREFENYYKKIYGKDQMFDLWCRMVQVRKTGSSAVFKTGDDVETLIANNRAGRNEKTLDKESFLNRFCRPRYRWRGQYERNVISRLKYVRKGLRVIWNKE